MRRFFFLVLLVVLSPLGWAQTAGDMPQELLTEEGVGGEVEVGESLEPKEESLVSEMEDGEYAIRLRQLQQRVDDLKQRTFDSKSRLLLLREQILHQLISEARAVIRHVNNVSALLTLDEALYFLDNQKIYYQSNQDGTLDSNRDFVIFEGSVSPGNHLLSVELVFRGNGKLFTYLDGYMFRVKSSFTFYAEKGHGTDIHVIGYEKGGLGNAYVDRPSVKFDVQQHKLK